MKLANPGAQVATTGQVGSTERRQRRPMEGMLSIPRFRLTPILLAMTLFSILSADAAAQVEAGEERNDGQALHGRGQVLADQLAQRVGLALELERLALDLLAVLELHADQPGHLDGGPGRPGAA